MNFPVIALLTDFGSRDGYTGVLKGVIYNRLQSAGITDVPVADISHEIPPQDIWHGAWVLGNSYAVYPPNTIFVCVVDPGVGSGEQKPLLLYWPEREYFFIAPDNGLLTPIIQTAGESLQGFVIENADLYLTPTPSRTFHGRDIYSPVAGRLAVALAEKQLPAFLRSIGAAMSTFQTLNWQTPQKENKCLTGQVMHVDTYGNIITNIPNEWLADLPADITIEANGPHRARRSNYYKEGKPGDLLVLAGSSATVEFARFGESAAAMLKLPVSSTLSLL